MHNSHTRRCSPPQLSSPPRASSITNLVYLPDGYEFHSNFSRKGKYIISCCKDSSIRIWNSKTLEIHDIIQYADHNNRARNAVVADDGSSAVITFDNGDVKLFQLSRENGQYYCVKYLEDTKNVRACALSADHRYAGATFFKGRKRPRRGMPPISEFSGFICLYNLDTTETTCQIPIGGIPDSLRISLDGRYIFVGMYAVNPAEQMARGTKIEIYDNQGRRISHFDEPFGPQQSHAQSATAWDATDDATMLAICRNYNAVEIYHSGHDHSWRSQPRVAGRNMPCSFDACKIVNDKRIVVAASRGRCNPSSFAVAFCTRSGVPLFSLSSGDARPKYLLDIDPIINYRPSADRNSSRQGVRFLFRTDKTNLAILESGDCGDAKNSSPRRRHSYSPVRRERREYASRDTRYSPSTYTDPYANPYGKRRDEGSCRDRYYSSSHQSLRRPIGSESPKRTSPKTYTITKKKESIFQPNPSRKNLDERHPRDPRPPRKTAVESRKESLRIPEIRRTTRELFSVREFESKTTRMAKAQSENTEKQNGEVEKGEVEEANGKYAPEKTTSNAPIKTQSASPSPPAVLPNENDRDASLYNIDTSDVALAKPSSSSVVLEKKKGKVRTSEAAETSEAPRKKQRLMTAAPDVITADADMKQSNERNSTTLDNGLSSADLMDEEITSSLKLNDNGAVDVPPPKSRMNRGDQGEEEEEKDENEKQGNPTATTTDKNLSARTQDATKAIQNCIEHEHGHEKLEQQRAAGSLPGMGEVNDPVIEDTPILPENVTVTVSDLCGGLATLEHDNDSNDAANYESEDASEQSRDDVPPVPSMHVSNVLHAQVWSDKNASSSNDDDDKPLAELCRSKSYTVKRSRPVNENHHDQRRKESGKVSNASKSLDKSSLPIIPVPGNACERLAKAAAKSVGGPGDPASPHVRMVTEVINLDLDDTRGDAKNTQVRVKNEAQRMETIPAIEMMPAVETLPGNIYNVSDVEGSARFKKVVDNAKLAFTKACDPRTSENILTNFRAFRTVVDVLRGEGHEVSSDLEKMIAKCLYKRTGIRNAWNEATFLESFSSILHDIVAIRRNNWVQLFEDAADKESLLIYHARDLIQVEQEKRKYGGSWSKEEIDTVLEEEGKGVIVDLKAFLRSVGRIFMV